MARCGIRLRHPVFVIPLDDEGGSGDPQAIGDAETLGDAIALAERNGFQIRDASDGGTCEFSQASEEGNLHFNVTVYPQ